MDIANWNQWCWTELELNRWFLCSFDFGSVQIHWEEIIVILTNVLSTTAPKFVKMQIWVQSLTTIWSQWWFPFQCGFVVYWIEVCGNCDESQFDVLLLQLPLALIYHDTLMHIVLTENLLVLKINSHADNRKSILSQRRAERKRIIHCFESNFSVAEVIGFIRLKIGF